MSYDKTFINLDRAVIQKGGLRKFIELSWHQIEPGKTFVPGWHIDAICDHNQVDLCFIFDGPKSQR